MKQNYILILIVMLINVSNSFLTNILAILIPEAKTTFNLSLSQVGLLPFALFIAYGVICIPSGYIYEKYGDKFCLVLAFFTSAIGSLLFSIIPNFIIYIISLFIIGSGIAMLHVVTGPLLRNAGGVQYYSFYSLLAQLIFGITSFVSPIIYSKFMVNIDLLIKNNIFNLIAHYLIGKKPVWIFVYWICSIVCICMLLIVYCTKFINTRKQKFYNINIMFKLLKNKIVILYFFGIFAYVGVEIGITFWLSKYLNFYFNFDSNTIGAVNVACFWGMFAIGGVIGLILVKLIDIKIILVVCTSCAIITLIIALCGSAAVALCAFPICGLFLSVIYPGIYSLALNSVEEHHESFNGILCTGITGGAIIPLLIGVLGDSFNLRIGMFLNVILLIFLLVLSVIADPLINNKKIFDKDL